MSQRDDPSGGGWMALFDDDSFRRVAVRVWHGLRRPRDCGEYRYARQQIRRLWAPVLALIVPVVAVLIMLGLSGRHPGPAPEAVTVTLLNEPEDVEPVELEPVDTPSETVDPMSNDMPLLTDIPGDEPAVDATPIFVSAVAPVMGQPTVKLPSGARLGDGGVGGGGFGWSNSVTGDLRGRMYDLKRNRRGNPRAPDFQNDIRRMVKDVERLAKGEVANHALDDYYVVPKSLYLSHLFIPYSKAETAPAAFGVEKQMEPSRWVVHYSGTVQPEVGGAYRFVGEFDDIMIVLVDGRVVLEVGWGGNVTGWTPKLARSGHKCFTGHELVYGDWLNLGPQEAHRIDMLIGEDPGGWVGGVLLIEKKGFPYGRTADGRPLLPVCSFSMLSPGELGRLADFNQFEFSPIMHPMRLPETAGRRVSHKSDVDVQISF